MKALRFPPTVVPSGRPFPHHPPVVAEARVPNINRNVLQIIQQSYKIIKGEYQCLFLTLENQRR